MPLKCPFFLATFIRLCFLLFGCFPFQRSPSISASLDGKVGHILIVIFITVTLHLVDRQTEYIARVDYTLELHVIYFLCSNFLCTRLIVLINERIFLQFRWKQQFHERQKESERTKNTIKILVQNILPAHVG